MAEHGRGRTQGHGSGGGASKKSIPNGATPGERRTAAIRRARLGTADHDIARLQPPSFVNGQKGITKFAGATRGSGTRMKR